MQDKAPQYLAYLNSLQKSMADIVRKYGEQEKRANEAELKSTHNAEVSQDKQKKQQMMIQKLQASLKEAINQLKNLRAWRAAKQAEINQKNTDINDLKLQLEDIQNSMKDTRERALRFDDAHHRSKNLELERDNLQSQLAELETSNELLIQTIEKHENLIGDQKHQIDSLNSQKEKLIGDLHTTRRTLTEKEAQEGQMRQDVVSAQTRSAKLTKQLQNVSKERDSSRDEQKALNDRLSAVRSKNESLQKQLKRAGNQLQDAMTECQSLRRAYGDTGEITILNRELKHATQANKKLSDKNSELETKLADALRQLETCETRATAAEESLAACKATRSPTSEQLSVATPVVLSQQFVEPHQHIEENSNPSTPLLMGGSPWNDPSTPKEPLNLIPRDISPTERLATAPMTTMQINDNNNRGTTPIPPPIDEDDNDDGYDDEMTYEKVDPLNELDVGIEAERVLQESWELLQETSSPRTLKTTSQNTYSPPPSFQAPSTEESSKQKQSENNSANGEMNEELANFEEALQKLEATGELDELDDFVNNCNLLLADDFDQQ
eukprot:TRINITY_DN29739_c0_g1_i1.p1 TRINITY_DN29739_c0_g1~~TRINITY_DN29739_c0_g1_i1.p1  ORF type:complete len:629 (-),score=218.21 TRINITY_DN29739_c0_g1_i1:427-2085(-)